MRAFFSFLFMAVLLLLLTIKFGYEFGYNDQVELLPYSYYLAHQQFYTHDFFIQGLHASLPNERTVMASVLLPFIDNIAWWNIVFHIATSLLLFAGLLRLATLLSGSLFIAMLAVAISLVVLNDYGIGNNEVWTASFQASNLAAAIIVWCFYFYAKQYNTIAFLLLAVASIIQPLEGLNVFFGMVAFSLYNWRKTKHIQPKVVFAIALYLLTAGVFMLLLFMAKSNAQSSINSTELFSILFLFRHPHHFIFSEFPIHKIAATFLLGMAAATLFFHQYTQLSFWIVLGLVGILIYALFTDVLHFIPVANFQFYKVAQWIKFFGVVAMAKWLHSFWVVHFSERRLAALGVAAFLVILAFAFKNINSKQSLFWHGDADMVAICKQIEIETPVQAVFIQPFENTELKWFGKRSSYVEFKANVRNKQFVGEWYRRLQEVYGITANDGVKGFALQQKANYNFSHLNLQQLQHLKQEGVTHLLTFSSVKIDSLQPILQNNSYAVYQL